MLNKFNYKLNYKLLNFRINSELYRVGKGEQGVMLVEPYKSEILPHWRFKTPDFSLHSSIAIKELFYKYKCQQDFVGMDMARKFLQMGYTRARRYANHSSGKKYDGPVPKEKLGQSGSHGRPTLPLDTDNEKAKSAKIFYEAWQEIEQDQMYVELKKGWKVLRG